MLKQNQYLSPRKQVVVFWYCLKTKEMIQLLDATLIEFVNPLLQG